ncbi:MAG: PadR family transcriptional regulator [Phycisphaerales bacterium]|nr:PadR family transcriptional regulator [Phycisphaerales bacterium]
MPPPPLSTRHSELECFVLGLVWQTGPASAYDIRRRMAESPSTQWSASAGAIYPLVQRLHRRRLLSAQARATGKRPRRVYAITPAGLAVLRAWIGPPLSPEAISVAYDPLRSRARFLAALPPARRLAWIAAARAALDEVERKVRAWDRAHAHDPIAGMITRNGELDVQSRSRWLDEFAQALGPGRQPHL